MPEYKIPDLGLTQYPSPKQPVLTKWGSVPMPTPDRRTGREIASEHEFLGWIAKFHRLGIDVRKQREIVVSESVSARFAIRIENDGAVALGVQETDLRALMSMTWTSACIARQPFQSNLIGLTTGGARAVKLWIPISEQLTEKFEDIDPSIFRVRQIRAQGSIIGVRNGPPRLELPFVKIKFQKPEKEMAASA